MSYESLVASAETFDPLDGSTIGSPFGSITYSAGGPFGQQMATGNGSGGIAYSVPSLSGAATIAGFVRIDSSTANDSAAFAWTNGLVLRVLKDGSNVDIRTQWYDGGFKQSNRIRVNAGQLYHLAIAGDGTNHRLYIDGALTATVASGGLQSVGNDGMQVMDGPNKSSMTGSVGEFGVWNLNLDASNIATLIAGTQSNSLLLRRRQLLLDQQRRAYELAHV